MNALLTLFSGPYALIARVACYAALVLAIASGGAYAMHKWDAGELANQKAETVKVQTAFDKFKADTAAAGNVAKAKADAQTLADKLAKDQADAEHARTVAALTLTIDGLRKQRPAGSFVPAAPAGTSRPDLICFDRAAYSAADGEFTSGARGLADEGTAATIDIDTAKRWAQNPAPPGSAAGGTP